jgi:hypothetical protein
VSTQLIVNSTNASPFEYPANTRIDMQLGAPAAGTNTRLLCLMRLTTADNYQLFFADSPWTTWTAYTSTLTVRTNIVDVGSIFISNDNWVYWCYRTNESSEDRIYVRRLSLYTGLWSTEILVSAVANGGVAGAIYGGLDMHLVVYAGQVVMAIAAGVTEGAQIGVTVLGVYWNTSGVASATQNVVPGVARWLYTGTGRIQPSVDIEHYGDGKSAGVPHLWIAFGRARLQMVKMAWNGAGWTGPVTAQELVATGMPARDYTTARWDGGRFMIAVPNTSPTDTVLLIERNQANTSTISRTSPPHTTGVIRHVALSYNAVTGDARIYAVGTSTAVLYYVDYLRATNLWTSWATVLATALIGATGEEFGVRRGSVGNARHDVYTAHAAGVCNHTNQTLSYAPFTPTWAVTSGQAGDVALPLVLDWDFSDADPGDTQSAYAISRQIGAGALAYFRASDQTWQVAEVQNTSGTSSRILAAAWGAGTDQPHTYKVKVWDQTPTASGYSDALVVIASAMVTPVATAPTPAQVIGFDTIAVTWTATEQTQYRITLTPGLLDFFSRVVANGWGTATTGQVYAVTGTAADFAVNGTQATITPSALATRRIAVLDTGAADHEVRFTTSVAVLPATGSWEVNAALRFTNSSNYYFGGWFVAPGGAITYVLNKIVAGVVTTMVFAASGLTYVAGTAMAMRARVQGNQIMFKIWVASAGEPSAWTFAVADTDLPTGNSAGAIAQNSTAVTTHVWTYDNLIATTLPEQYDSGWRAEVDTRSFTPPVTMPNNTGWAVTVETRNLEGLPSGRVAVGFTVVYLEPNTPTLVATPVPASGWISVAITNPAPSGGRPAVASNDLYRRMVGDTVEVRVAVGLANGATYNDWGATDGVNFEYRALAAGVNGTSIFSAWTP